MANVTHTMIDEKQQALAGGFRYTCSDGRERMVVLALERTGEWSVYDISAGPGAEQHGLLVGSLEGCEADLTTALALAREYRTSQQEFHAGNRAKHPCPDPLRRPSTAPIREVRAAIARAEAHGSARKPLPRAAA